MIATGGGLIRDLLDAHAAPKRDVAPYVLGRRRGGRVEPGCVRVRLPVHRDRVVARLALPRAGGVRAARGEKLPAHGLRREVLVALDLHRPVALRDHPAVPHRPIRRPHLGLLTLDALAPHGTNRGRARGGNPLDAAYPSIAQRTESPRSRRGLRVKKTRTSTRTRDLLRQPHEHERAKQGATDRHRLGAAESRLTITSSS